MLQLVLREATDPTEKGNASTVTMIDSFLFILMLIASCDPNYQVASIGENGLKRLAADFEDTNVVALMSSLYLGDSNQTVRKLIF
jgi:hypothetical protein